ncbi:flagellar hook-associated protein 2 [Methylophilus rhizosphaerae]|uniref:Flagellar hook-associated protein 2 n=1 Tax=Methylophilus rhizosphaerae TaxID=492660 RepID=A0A1G8ZEQ3_9PROT|nr:flagellar filament capping protein FliD [Methylophilus rhizosphaerae]SDK12885.1 flagellar hook-associated protein 2 [Methylophilus rhizosphaerae]
MATITPTTGASGLAIDSIVTGLMTIEKQPLTQLQTQISSYNTKLSAYGTLKSGLSTFQAALDKLSTAAKFTTQTATLSDGSSIVATADGTATSGSYNISVNQLAASQKLATAAFANTSDIIGTGTLKISFGTYNAADTTNGTAASFTSNLDKQAITITIDSSNNTLSGIRDAINAQNASVSASIVNDGSGNRLVITSKETGEVNSMKIDVTDADGNSTDGTGLSALAYDPLATAGSGKNMTQLVAAQNALLTVDGLAVSKSSNTLSDVIQGVTLNLKSVTSTNATLEVATDTSAIQDSVQSFVDAYNKLNSTLNDLTKFVEGGSSSNGPLLGDSTARDIMVKLKGMLAKTSPTATTFRTLADIGIKSSYVDGSLSLDSDKLAKALSTNLSDVAKLFAPSATTSDPQVTYMGSSSKTLSGTYAINVSQLADGTQSVAGTINGVAAIGSGANLTGGVDNAAQGLKIMINGSATGSRGTVTFSQGLAGELSSMIDSWLQADVGSLTVKTDGIQTSIKGLQDRYDDLNAKMPAIEQRYRTQYANLDALLSSMQSTSSYLSQQIAALNKS